MVRVVKNPEIRRQEIIAAACQLFLKKGYDSTTMKDVMSELNIAKGTIYHYFKSKEVLLEAVIDALVQDEVARMQQVNDQFEGTALERIQHLALHDATRHSDDHEDFLQYLHQPANAGMHIRILAGIITAQAQLYAELIRQGCNEGVFTTENPLECAEFLLAGIQFLVDAGVSPWTDEQLRRRWRAFPSLLESLLNAPAGSFSFLSEFAPQS